MHCEELETGTVELTVHINDELFAHLKTGTLGRSRQFLYQGTVIDEEYAGGPFLIRAGGLAETTAGDPEELRCSSQGFAEFFEDP